MAPPIVLRAVTEFIYFRPWAPSGYQVIPKRLQKEPKVTKMTPKVPLKAENASSKCP